MHVTQISSRTTLLFLDGHHSVPPTVPARRVLDHCVDAPAVPHLGDTKLEKNINYLRILGEKIDYSYWIHHLERQVETGVKSMTDWYVKDEEKEPTKHVSCILTDATAGCFPAARIPLHYDWNGSVPFVTIV